MNDFSLERIAKVGLIVTAVLGGLLLERADATTYTWLGYNSTEPTNHGWKRWGNYVGGTGIGAYNFTADDTIYYSSPAATQSWSVYFGGNGTIGTLEFGPETAAHSITATWGANAIVNLAAGILVDAGAGANTINAPLVLAPKTGSVVTLTNNSTSSFTFGAASGFSGNSDLSVTGNFVFQATNSYTGATTVNGGTLLLGASAAIGSTASTTIKSGATLAGTGNVAGTTVIESGATLSAGGLLANQEGAFGFGGNLILSSGSQIQLGLTNSANDSVDVGGILTYGGELRLTLSDDFAGAGAYTLFDFGQTGSAAGGLEEFTIYGESLALGSLIRQGDTWSGIIDGRTFSFDQNTGILNIAAVPEPHGIALLALGGVLIYAGRKSKQQPVLNS